MSMTSTLSSSTPASAGGKRSRRGAAPLLPARPRRRSSGHSGSGLRADQLRPVRACTVAVATPAVSAVSTRPDPTRATPGEYRLTRRGQALAVSALALVAFGSLSVAGAASTATTGPRAGSAVVYQTITVQPGESLWEIARETAPAVDPRTTIGRIIALNDLPGDGSIRAGQRITVPTTY